MALQWLARREHSRRELLTKLAGKGCDTVLATAVVQQLEVERLVSDDRFMESLITARRRRGYGPLKIQKELQEKGVAPEVIDLGRMVSGEEWLEDIRRVQRKKFGGKIPKSHPERARQARFLQYRGFTYDQIRQLFDPRAQD